MRQNDHPKKWSKARLTKKEQFDKVFRSGKRFKSKGLAFIFRQADEKIQETPLRLGFAVSRHYGNAVSRNKLKRRLRGQLRQYQGPLRGDCIVLPNKGSRDIDHVAVSSSFAHAFSFFENSFSRKTASCQDSHEEKS